MPRVANPLTKVRKRLEPCCFGAANFKNLHKDKDKASDPDKHLNFYRHYIPIQREIVPRIDEALDLACERLGLNRDNVHGFVKASPEINAMCKPGIRGNAVIFINSGMIEKLTMDELIYVMGHELGHYVMPFFIPHVTDGSGESRPASMEDAICSRHLEISMDRFGLVACRNLQAACSAALKIQSGLGSEHVVPDFGAYAKETIKGYVHDHTEYEGEAYCSHPAAYVRIRALHHFAQSEGYLALIGSEGGKAMNVVDADVEKDMQATLDFFAGKLMDDALADLSKALAGIHLDMEGVVELQSYVTGLIPAPSVDSVKEFAALLGKVPVEDKGKVVTDHLTRLTLAAVNRCPRRTLAHLAELSEKLKGTHVHGFVEDASEKFQAAFKQHFKLA